LHFCKSELGLAKDRQQKLGLQLSNVESQLQLVRNDNESLKQANRELRGALTEEQSRVEKQEGELKEMQNFKKALELKSLNLQKLRQEQDKCRE
jgi:DNA-binding transcriptional MerR regulator